MTYFPAKPLSLFIFVVLVILSCIPEIDGSKIPGRSIACFFNLVLTSIWILVDPRHPLTIGFTVVSTGIAIWLSTRNVDN